MLDDARLGVTIHGALMRVAVPEIELSEIRRRTGRRHAPTRLAFPRFAMVSATSLLIIVALTSRAPAVVQSIEERLRAALATAGIGPGVQVRMIPASIESRTVARQVTLADARRQADFPLVVPTGLPHDVTKVRIFAAPLALWSEARHAWSVEGRQITFRYDRANGKSFDLMADRFSRLSGAVPRFMYEVDDFSSLRKTIATRHAHFVWRNGTQELIADTSDSLSASEIARIRTAMRGIELRSYDGRRPPAKRLVRYRIPMPPAP